MVLALVNSAAGLFASATSVSGRLSATYAARRTCKLRLLDTNVTQKLAWSDVSA